MKSKQLLVGTSKGLVYVEHNAQSWIITKSQFRGIPVTMVYIDERTNTWWVGLAHRHWGQKLNRSIDNGNTWEEVSVPKYPQTAQLHNGKSAVLRKIWSMQHAGPDRPNGLWLGTEPGGLFYSADNGDHFDLVEGLWNHPSRSDEQQWFGAGRDEPFIHSIVRDERNSDHLYVAVSCAGVFETKDGGQKWQPKNEGLIAAYLPNPNVEVGHDPHMMFSCQSDPDVLWQQNHCGIFRSVDGANSWENVTDQNGLADYGFALAIDHQNPLRAWTIPAISDVERVAPDLALCVCVTEDGGQNWRALRNGLPQNFVYDIVFRHALDISDSTLAFGTTNGNLYLSSDYGESWSSISNQLARVETLQFVKQI